MPMEGNLIVNGDKDLSLSDVIKKIIPMSKSLYFLVGYFYFSGFKEIYEGTEDKNLEILVGMDIEKDMLNNIKEVEMLNDMEFSNTSIKEKYYDSLVSFINETDYFDTRKNQEAFDIFLRKIKNGSLRIKKTSIPNHSKVYLFENKDEFNQGGTYPGTLIVGSSNLTFSGLEGREEFNVILRSAEDYRKAKGKFEELWEKAIDIVSPENKEDFFKNVVEKVWVNKLPKPYLMYIRVLKEYFDVSHQKQNYFPSKITDNKYYDLKYQVDAISRALAIIEKHNGVIIADVVGLGKSIIASAVAHTLGLKTIVIVPPHLREQWENYRLDFDYNAKVYSAGKIEKAVEENMDNEEKLIIIDEAHRYRNEMTQDYANLHKLCQGNKVILLTATPYNNKPQDIFSLIKFFQISARSTLQTVDNLSDRFKELINEYKEIDQARKKEVKSKEELENAVKSVASKIRNLISPLMIRRSRIDLEVIKEYKKDLEIQKVKFPKVNDPIILDYDLGELTELYESTLEKISPKNEKEKGFQGIRYKPVAYLKNIEKYKRKIEETFGSEELFKQSQLNMAIFMRRHLVIRFESSMEAFRKSLNNMIQSMENILNWYDKIKMIPIYKKGQIPNVEDILEEGDSYLLEEVKELSLKSSLEKLKKKGYEFIEAKELKKGFKVDLVKDIELLREIRKEWFGDKSYKDPKLESFKKNLEKQLQNENRKIVVFSQFADTVDYLYENLKQEFPVLKYTGSNSTLSQKNIIVQEFDASSKKQTNKYRILIATDAISEGFNLNRADSIFNYDIPYNPTRVIQRVGRINRINNNLFDELYIYNFFPSSTGEREISLKKISTLKFAMINAILGEDTKVLTSDEELQTFFREQYKELQKESEEESWDAKYINFLKEIESSNPELIKKALEIPKRSRIRRSVKTEKSGVIVFGRKGNNYIFKLADGIEDESIKTISDQEALSLFEATIDEDAQNVSENFDAVYQNIKKDLFSRKTQNSLDQTQRKAIEKLDILSDYFTKDCDYFKDIRKVIVDYNALPRRYEEMIKNIKLNTKSIRSGEEEIKKIKSEIPKEYIQKIINRAMTVNEEPESIILSEELI